MAATRRCVPSARRNCRGVPREVVDWVARRPAEWRDALRRYVGGPELAEDDVTPGLHVVHGALPVRPTGDRLLPEVRPGATCIDTGAGFGGPLTAAIFTDLQAEPVGFFQAQEDGRCLFVPPRLAPPLGRDPRIALIHADGEPETAADWAIRQDSELLEAKLAAKRRQVRRRQLLRYGRGAGPARRRLGRAVEARAAPGERASASRRRAGRCRTAKQLGHGLAGPAGSRADGAGRRGAVP